MASALARGWGEPVLVADVDPARAEALAGSSAARRSARTPTWPTRADAVVLCHKPGQLDEVAAEIRGRAKAVVSILGGTRWRRRGRLPGPAGLPLHAEHPGRGARGRVLLRAGLARRRTVRSASCSTLSAAPARSCPLPEPLIDAGHGGHGLRPRLLRAGGRGAGRRRCAPRPAGRTPRCSWRSRRMAGSAAVLRASGFDTAGAAPARDLAGRLDRPRPRGARARRRARGVRRRRRRRRGPGADDPRCCSPRRRASDVADYVGAFITVYVVLIFIRILMS